MKRDEDRPGRDVADRGADRERARQKQLRLFLEEGSGLREEPVDLGLAQLQRPADEVLAELVDRLDGAVLDGRPLPGDLPDGEPEEPDHDRERAERPRPRSPAIGERGGAASS